MNFLRLNTGDKVDQDIQTNVSTIHLEETGYENQVQTEKIRNYNSDGSEKEKRHNEE